MIKKDYINGQFAHVALAIAEANKLLNDKNNGSFFFAEKYTYDREREELRFKYISIHNNFDDMIGDKLSLRIKFNDKETVQSLSIKIFTELKKAIKDFKKYIVKPSKDY